MCPFIDCIGQVESCRIGRIEREKPGQSMLCGRNKMGSRVMKRGFSVASGDEQQQENIPLWARHLDTQAGLAPVPSLSVVAVGMGMLARAFAHPCVCLCHLVRARCCFLLGWLKGGSVNRTGWCCLFGGESIGEWGGSGSSP